MVHDAVTKAVEAFLEPGEQLRYGARARHRSTVWWKLLLKLGRRWGYVAVSDRRVLLTYDGESAPLSLPYDRLTKVEDGTFVHAGLVTLRELDGTEHPIEVRSLFGEDTYGHVTFLREAPDFLRSRIARPR